jgi:hypothetical protein
MLAERAYHGAKNKRKSDRTCHAWEREFAHMSCEICRSDYTLGLALMQTLYGAYRVKP